MSTSLLARAGLYHGKRLVKLPSSPWWPCPTQAAVTGKAPRQEIGTSGASTGAKTRIRRSLGGQGEALPRGLSLAHPVLIHVSIALPAGPPRRMRLASVCVTRGNGAAPQEPGGPVSCPGSGGHVRACTGRGFLAGRALAPESGRWGAQLTARTA